MKNIIKLMPKRENEQRTRINHIRRGGRAAAVDPGALTNMGITKRTYDEYNGTDVDEEGMRQLTTTDVEPIYKEIYWLKYKCHELPPGVDWAVFEWCVNLGPSRAAKALQRAVGASTD